MPTFIQILHIHTTNATKRAYQTVVFVRSRRWGGSGLKHLWRNVVCGAALGMNGHMRHPWRVNRCVYIDVQTSVIKKIRYNAWKKRVSIFFYFFPRIHWPNFMRHPRVRLIPWNPRGPWNEKANACKHPTPFQRYWWSEWSSLLRTSQLTGIRSTPPSQAFRSWHR